MMVHQSIKDFGSTCRAIGALFSILFGKAEEKCTITRENRLLDVTLVLMHFGRSQLHCSRARHLLPLDIWSQLTQEEEE
jgi:hypothetical protein